MILDVFELMPCNWQSARDNCDFWYYNALIFRTEYQISGPNIRYQAQSHSTKGKHCIPHRHQAMIIDRVGPVFN